MLRPIVEQERFLVSHLGEIQGFLYLRFFSHAATTWKEMLAWALPL